MLNEKELRPGNLYATLRNKEIVVVGIDTVNKFVTTIPSSNDTDIVNKNENSIIFEDLFPIEITLPKITELGFLEDQSLSININSDNDVRFIWDDNLKQVILVDGNSGIIGQEIKYVHQFQNIYYFLTGKELPLL
jgi:hypothetical protein